MGGAEAAVASTHVELFSPTSNSSCRGPDLPDQRVDHTTDLMSDSSLLTCGGIYTATTCLQLLPNAGTWIVTSTDISPRMYHTSWKTGDSVILMGGSDGSNYLATTEIVGGGPSFSLKLAAE